MGLFQKIKIFLASRQNRKSTTDSNAMTLYQALGIDPDTDPKALSEATYFACLKVLSESLGKLPLKIQQSLDGHGVITARTHPLYFVLHDRPNKYMTATTFWGTVENNRNHYGNAYVWIQGAGKNTQLWVLPSNEVEVWYDNGLILADQPDIYYRWSSTSGRQFIFGSEEILHFKTSTSFDGITGASVRSQLKATIGSGVKGQSIINRLYDGGMSGKLVLNYTGNLSDENATKFRNGIADFVNGKNDRDGDVTSVIPIPLGSTLQPLSSKLVDSQFLEIRQYTALQVAAAFGIKPTMIGDYSKSSYSSAEAQNLAFLTDTLLYILKGYEEEIEYKLLSNSELVSGYKVRFNTAVLLRADTASQVDSITKGIAGFLYTPNEGREMLDLPAKPGGDSLIGNGSVIRSEQIGIQYGTGGTEDET